LHCLLFLAGPPAGVREASVRDLAELQGVSVEYLAKLFTKLQKAGLVVATEGARGGFALARPPEKISVLDVVRAIDGHKSLFECRNIRENCALFGNNPPRWATSGVCSIHAVMLEAEKSVRESLGGHTLADLGGRVMAKAPEKYGVEIAHWLDERAVVRRGGRSQGHE
jgi:Rrf2 family protein